MRQRTGDQDRPAESVARSSITPSGGAQVPVLYAWDVDGPRGGECGVTDDRDRAISRVTRGLRDAGSGTSGRVRKVVASASGSVEYLELDRVGEARRDEGTGAVVWTGG
ncbi:hypothetical protein [Actinomadura fibrosa]|uniref:Uncharacterized protein n=1 Tax=Actinomadura fibrosa TaxID=111802 RepID=A0ABW2XHP0_9ACTN|nr:hypothetical protein [Actinomadura fibrosa]